MKKKAISNHKWKLLAAVVLGVTFMASGMAFTAPAVSAAGTCTVTVDIPDDLAALGAKIDIYPWSQYKTDGATFTKNQGDTVTWKFIVSGFSGKTFNFLVPNADTATLTVGPDAYCTMKIEMPAELAAANAKVNVYPWNTYWVNGQEITVPKGGSCTWRLIVSGFTGNSSYTKNFDCTPLVVNSSHYCKMKVVNVPEGCKVNVYPWNTYWVNDQEIVVPISSSCTWKLVGPGAPATQHTKNFDCTALVAGSVDNTPPVVTITAPAEGSYQTATLPALAYTVTDNDPSPSVVVSGWSTAEGTHTVTVTATDAAGNVGLASRTYTVDNTLPVVTITAPVNGAYYKSSAVPAAAFTVVDTNPYTTVEAGYSTTEGIQTYTVTATDNTGNVGSASVTYTVDNTAPVVTITAPVNGAYYKTADVPALAYSVDETNPYTVVEAGYSTDEGVQTVTVTATDSAGNVGADSVTYTVDNTPPEVTIGSPENGKTYLNTQGPIPVQYTATDICDSSLTITMTLDGNPFTGDKINLCGMASGEHTLVVSAADDSGNTGTDSATFNVVPQSLKTFTIKHMLIQWARPGKRSSLDKDTFTLSGRLQLPEGCTVGNLNESATLTIAISDASGTDTVLCKVRPLNKAGIIWKYNGKEQPPGEGMNIHNLIIWWTPQSGKWAGWAGFHISGVLQLPEEIGVNTQPAEATVTIEMPAKTESGCGSLIAKNTVKFKVLKSARLWLYNMWPNLPAFPCDPTGTE